MMLPKRMVLAFTAFGILSLGLAWIGSGFQSFQVVGSYLAVITLSALILMGIWWSMRKEVIPDWVVWLVLGAALLRFAAGVIWYRALPVWGHGTEVENAGYIMSDAHRRDQVAWELAQSEDQLMTAFQDYRLADQYGGMLFLSAAVYRVFGSSTHQPLLMVVITATVSSAAVLFTWAFTQRLWGARVAQAAVWILALYPDAVLLGSSQMREAFMMTLSGMGLFGLILYWQGHKGPGIGWVFGALALGFPLSTLFTVSLLGVLMMIAVILGQGKILRNWILWAVLGGLFLLGIAGLWILGDRIYPEGASNPWELIQQWLVFASRWEKRSIALSSGWFNKVLLRSPEWMHLWLILGYGTVQPFLPAAIIASGNWIWKTIAIWRAVGWTAFLVLLLYAPVRGLQRIRESFLVVWVSLIVWVSVLLAAFRGGGDQWDNPRYRVTFIILQAALAAWVYVKQRESSDPWLRRVLVGLGLVFAWFVPWYLRRYSSTFTWPIDDLFKTLGLGFITAILFWIWDWARCEDGKDSVEPKDSSPLDLK